MNDEYELTAVEPSIFQSIKHWFYCIPLVRYFTDNPKKCNLYTYAESELYNAGYYDDEYGSMMAKAVLKLMEEFCKEGHSGFSANACINIFNTLAKYEPLTPLEGTDDEWTLIYEEMLADKTKPLYQNKRCGRVFKEEYIDENNNFISESYDIDGKIFRNSDGSCYTNSESKIFITFPYIPKTEYVNV